MRLLGHVRRLIAPTLVLGLLMGASVVNASPPNQDPGPAVDRLYFKAFDVDRAPLDIQKGNMDLYLFGLKVAAASELRTVSGIDTYEAPATTLSILLNPAPAPEGQLNPFSIPEVRRAFQFLVNRDFVAASIYRGMAVPMLTHVSPMDYDHLTIYDLVHETSIRYDPEFARQRIRRSMLDNGAELVNGKWAYGGAPVVIKGIIRVEDERREVGDLLRAELDQAGFQVVPAYQTFAPAIQRVYSSDPASLQWHFYTEGWGRSAPERYDFGAINHFAAPWMGNMPGWRAAGFWQFQNDDLDRIGKRIFTGQFSTLEERNDLYEKATKLAMDDSVRIWVATVMNSFPANEQLAGVTQDIVAGPRSPWTLREAQIPGRNELTVGHLWVWTERTTWNPVGGFGDVYSTDIWRNLSDPPIWNHPFTGIPIPFRATFVVETEGPVGKLEVPQDAVLLDSDMDRWVPVGLGIEAVSKVTFDYSKYFQSKWHHGQSITMADVIYSIYQNFDIAYDEKKSEIEFATAVTARPYLETYKGFRVLDGNRLEVYVDFWHFEENNIASYASPSDLSMPWEVLWAMDTLVFEKRQAAYSDTAAGRFQVPWISLVMPKDARLVRNTLRDLAAANSMPSQILTMGGTVVATESDADRRYLAVMDWFEEYGMLVIANGPFVLTRYDPPAQFAELEAFRDPDYPFHAGDWNFGVPELIRFQPIDLRPLNIGQDYNVGIDVEGPGHLGVRYVLIDPVTGKILGSGDLKELNSGVFDFALKGTLTATLEPGLYHLYVAAYSDSLARTTERRVDIEARHPVSGASVKSNAIATPVVGPVSKVATETEDQTNHTGSGCGRGQSADLTYGIIGTLLVGIMIRRRASRSQSTIESQFEPGDSNQ
jgi:peptide/nickel transport system substrate-binding protein